MSANRYYILVVQQEDGELSDVAQRLQSSFGDVFAIESANTFNSGLERIQSLSRIGRKLSLIVVDERLGSLKLKLFCEESIATEALAKIPLLVLRMEESLESTSALIEHSERELRELSSSQSDQLIEASKTLLTDYFAKLETPDLVKVAKVLDVQRLSEDFIEVNRERNTIRTEFRDFKSGLLITPWKSDDEILEDLVSSISKIVQISDYTWKYKKGQRILVEGERNANLTIILSGKIALSKTVEGEKIDLGCFEAGKIIGLLSFVERNPVFANAFAVTDCELLEIGAKDLQRLMDADSKISSIFFNKISRSMAERIRMHVKLQVEIRELSREVARERDELQLTLSRLDKARLKLVETEKMAVLGQFVAGIAHELNNPAGALLRGSAQLGETLISLLERLEALSDFDIRDFYEIGSVVLSKSLTADPKSLREIRSLTRSMERKFSKISSPHEHARMLSEIHLDEKELVAFIAKRRSPDSAIEILHCFHQIGQGLRHIRVSSERVNGIVGSLRSYARPETEEDISYDVNRGLNDTLLILANKFKSINVVRNFDKSAIASGNPGALNQVWTNLLVNSAEAMGGRGVLAITTQNTGGSVVVSIEDDGPGIPPNILKKIWDLNFTTKTGANSFGLGLGLAITKSIVETHNGIISVESHPGRTKFTVVLPLGKTE